MDVSHAILFLENADFVRITGLYFPALEKKDMI